MGKLSQAQKDTLESLYDEGEYDPEKETGLSVKTLRTLEGSGFVQLGSPPRYRKRRWVWFLTKFGANVVKVMRGELRRKRRRR